MKKVLYMYGVGIFFYIPFTLNFMRVFGITNKYTQSIGITSLSVFIILAISIYNYMNKDELKFFVLFVIVDFTLSVLFTLSYLICNFIELGTSALAEKPVMMSLGFAAIIFNGMLIIRRDIPKFIRKISGGKK